MNAAPIVSIARCADYSEQAVARALDEALAPLGGLDWVQPGMHICIKANLVSGMKPEAAATTHPALLRELILRLKQRGARAIVGDSPGGLYTAAFVNRIYEKCGLKPLEDIGGELNRDFGEVQARNPEAKVAKEFTYTSWLDGADAIIDFCKLKSHGMMSMSAAVKNLFGTIPGTMKPEYHFRFPNERDFADMLVDLNLFFKPRLTLVDAVIGMEGNGPTAGTPRTIGAILASNSTFHADVVCAEIIGVTMDDVPTLRAAYERGLAPADSSGITVSGDLQAIRIPDFRNILNHSSLRFTGSGKGPGALVGRLMESVLISRPGVVDRECVGCAVCARTCPANAIDMRTGKPRIDRRKCIRCFCCQEFCPKGAMKVKRHPIARLLDRGAGRKEETT